MNNISTHITYREAIKSNTALRLNIDNTPQEYELSNMRTLANKVFEPLREWVGGPIKINSMYRCPELNTAIGGSSNSQHCMGKAMDIDDVYGHKTNAEMFQYIRDNLEFDQMIWEFGDDDNPDWVHVSYVNERDNRNKCLKAFKKDGKTHYMQI